MKWSISNNQKHTNQIIWKSLDELFTENPWIYQSAGLIEVLAQKHLS